MARNQNWQTAVENKVHAERNMAASVSTAVHIVVPLWNCEPFLSTSADCLAGRSETTESLCSATLVRYVAEMAPFVRDAMTGSVTSGGDEL